MTPAQNLTNRILYAASQIGARLFVMTTGKFWTGRVVFRAKKRGGVTIIMEEGDIVLRSPRLVNVGFKGLSDTIGGVPVTITPDMVGQTVLIFTAIEVKYGNDRPSPEQLKFIEQIKKLGGRAGIAKSEDDALRVLGGLP